MATKDFEVNNHGSVVILMPMTAAATEWVNIHLPGDGPRWGPGGFVIEPRYMQPILEGIVKDKLTLEIN
jgi:hypothetical protein